MPSNHRNALIGTWLGLFFVLFYIASARGTLSFGDDDSMLQVTQSIATDASVAVPPGPGARRGIDGRYYSKFGLGQSILGLPFYVIGSFIATRYSDPVLRSANRDASPITYFACLLGIFSGAGVVVLLFLICIRLGFDELASTICAIGLGLCTFSWFYARTFMTEPTSTLCLVLTFYGLLLSSAKSTRSLWLFVSGLGLALAILVRLQNVIVLPVFGAYLIYGLRISRQCDWRATLVAIAIWSAPILASLSLVAIYDYLRFGTPTDTGFELGLSPIIFQNPWYVGVYGLLLSPGKGIFWYAPILLPALYGWKFLWKKCPEITAMLGLLIGSYLLFYAHVHWWFGGGCWGPRFMVEILPFLMIGFAALIDHGLGTIGWIVIGTAAALSFFVQITSVLVSYMPYVAMMIRTQETFGLLLWAPAYSPIFVEAKYLVHHVYPYDLAYNAYPSAFLAHVHLVALIAAIAVLASGIVIIHPFRRIRTFALLN
jgi:hypothetical protein